MKSLDEIKYENLEQEHLKLNTGKMLPRDFFKVYEKEKPKDQGEGVK